MQVEIATEIKQFILEEVLEDTEQTDIPDDIPLLSGLLDSFGLMSLISFLEDRYSLIIRNDEVTKQNFATVQALATFVGSRQTAADGAVTTA
ncbi:MAG TPA: acyl carrier protein [Actinomycetota bacterium]